MSSFGVKKWLSIAESKVRYGDVLFVDPEAAGILRLQAEEVPSSRERLCEGFIQLQGLVENISDVQRIEDKPG